MPKLMARIGQAIGNVLGTTSAINGPILPPIEPPDKPPEHKLGRVSGWAEPYNISTTLDAQLIQAAIRAAERGDTWQLFTIYRDMVLGYTHLQSEWSKRKMVVVGQPHTLIAPRKDNADDEQAVEVIEEMISHCDNWIDGIDHLLDATLYPSAVCEKLYEPVEPSEESDYEHPVRYRLRKLDPVNYVLFCYKIPYLSGGGIRPTGPYAPPPNGALSLISGNNPATIYDVDEWEPDLRFYSVFQNGYVDFSPSNVYAPDRKRHMVHRGNMVSKFIRDNFGGQMRAILFWWFLANQTRDWFGRYMQRFGTPFPVGYADAQQQGTLDLLQQAFSMSTQIGGLVVDKRAKVELIQAASQDGATAHKTLIDVCNREVSKLVIGQELSSTAKNTGLGSGVAALQAEVRDDIRQYDMRKLAETLKKQLFLPYLRINGYFGKPPEIIWGGKNENDSRLAAQTVQAFGQVGIEPTDEALDVISQRLGYGLQRNEKLLTRGKPGGDNPSTTDLKESKSE